MRLPFIEFFLLHGNGTIRRKWKVDCEKKSRALFEDEPVGTAILKLAMPAVIGQIILVIYNMADTFFVGLTGSDAMITSVTVCMPAFMILSAVANLFGAGGASAISRAAGASQRHRAKETASFAFWGCVGVTAIYSLVCLFFADGVVDLLGGANAAVHGHAKAYLITTVSIGGIATAFGGLMAHLMRSEGRSMQASIGIAIGGIANVALDPLFMFVIFEKGNEPLGAAVATMVSNVITAVYFASVMLKNRRNTMLGFALDKNTFNKDIAVEVLSVGLPACLMTLCENISFAVLDNLMAVYGTAMQAGLGVAKKVNMLAHCMTRGMAQGVLPLIGYNFASGNHKRMKKAAFTAAMVSVVLALACMAVCLGLSEGLIGLFIQHGSESVHAGASFLRILCIGGPFSAFAYMVVSFFQATGHGGKSLLLALMRKGMVDIPLMFALGALYPIYGLVWATPAADIICCTAAAILFALFLRQLERSEHADALHIAEGAAYGVSAR